MRTIGIYFFADFFVHAFIRIIETPFRFPFWFPLDPFSAETRLTTKTKSNYNSRRPGYLNVLSSAVTDSHSWSRFNYVGRVESLMDSRQTFL